MRGVANQAAVVAELNIGMVIFLMDHRSNAINKFHGLVKITEFKTTRDAPGIDTDIPVLVQLLRQHLGLVVL